MYSCQDGRNYLEAMKKHKGNKINFNSTDATNDADMVEDIYRDSDDKSRLEILQLIFRIYCQERI
jgi:hypothetical protein